MDDSAAQPDSANDATTVGKTVPETEVFEGDLNSLDKHARRELFRKNIYPYSNKLGRAEYEAFKYELQIELLKMQNWVKESGEKILVINEGRDAAGKGGTIKRVMQYLNPRVARIEALLRAGRAGRDA